MFEQYLTYLYGISQLLVFFIYIPSLKTIGIKSRSHQCTSTIYIFHNWSNFSTIYDSSKRRLWLYVDTSSSATMVDLYKQRKGRIDDRRKRRRSLARIDYGQKRNIFSSVGKICSQNRQMVSEQTHYMSPSMVHHIFSGRRHAQKTKMTTI